MFFYNVIWLHKYLAQLAQKIPSLILKILSLFLQCINSALTLCIITGMNGVYARDKCNTCIALIFGRKSKHIFLCFVKIPNQNLHILKKFSIM